MNCQRELRVEKKSCAVILLIERGWNAAATGKLNPPPPPEQRAPSAFPEYQMTKYIFVSKCIVFLHNFVLCIWWQRDFISGIISYLSLLSVCQMNINTSVGLRIACYLFKAILTSFQRVLFKFHVRYISSHGKVWGILFLSWVWQSNF